MKTTQLFTIGALVATAAAQTLDSLPACGKLCVNNMLEKASELGCAAGDVACLCKNVDFAYGIRDCSTAVCGAEAAAPVIAYGEKYCGSVGTTVNSSPSATTTIGGSPSGQTASAIVATITSGTQVYTSTLGFTTLTSSESIPSSVSSLTSSIGSSASSALASLSSQLSSVSSQASSASESATSTSSSSGARRTAIAGLAAAAGLAGLVL
ncbi:hypothetical protein K3495_g738 [Podosphaera aphanis]|nr:hypothetical protein K3495_g738 [Podosphaera aphanis]